VAANPNNFIDPDERPVFTIFKPISSVVLLSWGDINGCDISITLLLKYNVVNLLRDGRERDFDEDEKQEAKALDPSRLQTMISPKKMRLTIRQGQG
jgi:hypothetical protein